MAFIQGKCPNCAGIMAVDDAKDAMVCTYCNTPFIVEKAVNIFNNTTNYNSVTNVTAQNVVVSADDPAEKLFTRYCSLIKRKEYDLSYKTFAKLKELHPDSTYVDEARIHQWAQSCKAGPEYGNSDPMAWWGHMDTPNLYDALSSLKSSDEQTFDKYYTPLKEQVNQALNKLTGLNFSEGMLFTKIYVSNLFDRFIESVDEYIKYSSAYSYYINARSSYNSSSISAIPISPSEPADSNYHKNLTELLKKWTDKDFDQDPFYIAYIVDSIQGLVQNGEIINDGYDKGDSPVDFMEEISAKYGRQIQPYLEKVRAVREAREKKRAQAKFRSLYADAAEKYSEKKYERLNEVLKDILLAFPSPNLEAYVTKNIVKGLFGWKCKNALPSLETAFKWVFPE